MAYSPHVPLLSGKSLIAGDQPFISNYLYCYRYHYDDYCFDMYNVRGDLIRGDLIILDIIIHHYCYPIIIFTILITNND